MIAQIRNYDFTDFYRRISLISRIITPFFVETQYFASPGGRFEPGSFTIQFVFIGIQESFAVKQILGFTE